MSAPSLKLSETEHRALVDCWREFTKDELQDKGEEPAENAVGRGQAGAPRITDRVREEIDAVKQP